jgi:hypothetical protein
MSIAIAHSSHRSNGVLVPLARFSYVPLSLPVSHMCSASGYQPNQPEREALVSAMTANGIDVLKRTMAKVGCLIGGRF